MESGNWLGSRALLKLLCKGLEKLADNLAGGGLNHALSHRGDQPSHLRFTRIADGGFSVRAAKDDFTIAL